MSKTAVLLISPPGCGKSSGVEAHAASVKKKFVPLVLSQLDPCDVAGVIVPNANGLTCTRLLPDYWVDACKQPAVLFLDELTTSDACQLAVGLRACDDSRELSGMKLHEETEVIAACNDPEFSAGAARELSAPLLNRFRIRRMGPEHALAYMRGDPGLFGTKGCAHPVVRICAEYLMKNTGAALASPEEMRKAVTEQKPFPTPRGWCRAATEVGLVNGEVPLEWSEFLGVNTVATFRQFLKALDLPNIVDILAGRCLDVPKRGDAAMMTAGSLSSMLCGDEEPSKASIKNACKWFSAAAKLDQIASVYPALCQIIEKLGETKMMELDVTPFLPAMRAAGKSK